MGIEILVPPTLKLPEARESLLRLQPDIAVVVAYGKILPPDILAIPRLGCVNIHASILPELRGAAPIQWAIARGYTETGVTLMQMDEGMDTGPVLLQSRTPIGREETAGELGLRLAQIGADLIKEGLPLLEKGELHPIEQDHSLATYAPLLSKADGLIDWSMDAVEIADRARGFSPWPGTYTFYAAKRLLIHSAQELPQDLGATCGAEPGTVVRTGDAVAVVTGQGLLRLDSVQLEGRRSLNIYDFVSGQRTFVGTTLG